jgi:hypothetical protein
MSGSISAIDFTTTTGDQSGAGYTSKGAIIKTLPAIGYEGIVKIHGIMMFIAWGVFPFIAIYIARFMKHIGHRWYLLHSGIMLTTFVLTLVALFLIVLYKPPPHVNDPHAVFYFLIKAIGVLVVIGMLLQVILGFVTNALYDPERKSIPIQDTAHWWLGSVYN